MIARPQSPARPPRGMDLVARERWYTLYREFCAAWGSPTSADLARMHRYCEAYSRMIRASTALQEARSLTYLTYTGIERERPESRAERAAFRVMLRELHALGMTPIGEAERRRRRER